MNEIVYFFVGTFALRARDNFGNALGADCLKIDYSAWIADFCVELGIVPGGNK